MQTQLASTLAQLNSLILGKPQATRLALACLLARGHLLIEDLPGMGKTTLAHGLAQTLGLSFQRVQFTSDLLPSDIIGVSIYRREHDRFEFHPGPIFTQVLLADEINRATPKTQGALLEAMEERQISVDGLSRPLPEPFFVIATQNPIQQVGTYPLPESQLDRFLMRISLGYPDPKAERELLEGPSRRSMLENITSTIDTHALSELQQQVAQVRTSPALLDYVQDLLKYTRQARLFNCGLSPRAGLALLQAARAWALIDNRAYAVPEDVQAVFPAVAGHRLESREMDGDTATKQVLQNVAIR